jgi:hypothetical protein
MRESTIAGNTVELKLSRSIDRQLADDIEKQFVYVSPHITELRVTGAGDSVIARYDTAPTGDVVDKLCRFLDAMTAKFRHIEQRVQHERNRHPARACGPRIYQEMRERGWLFEHGEGQVSLSGPPLSAVNALDDRLAKIYRERFSAVDHSYPAMIKAELLARCGYFEMHPNAVSFVSHAIEDFDELEAFRRANVGQPKLVVPHDHAFALPRFCLNPAACFPCYEALEGKVMPAAGTSLTWRGRVFRYESRNVTALDRLWEFNVRELVFLGNDAFVLNGRTRAIEAFVELCEEWDLDCRVETATDPFFATVYAAKTFWQQTQDVKQEVRVTVEAGGDGSGRTIAAGSFNLHGAFFGTRFHIDDDDGRPAVTGCVGFGLERLMFGMFAQHGLQPAAWPTALRSEVFG